MRSEKLMCKVLLQVFLVISTLFYSHDLSLDSKSFSIQAHVVSSFSLPDSDSASDNDPYGPLGGTEEDVADTDGAEYLDEGSFLLSAENLKTIAFDCDDFYLGNFYSCLFKPPCLV